jgi:hypothetical protein
MFSTAAFCLPLDFITQVVLTSIFFCIHFQATVAQMAYPFELLLQRVPQLLWLQLGLERAAAAAARLLPHAAQLLQLATGSSDSSRSLAMAADGFCHLNETVAPAAAAALSAAASSPASKSIADDMTAAIQQQQQQQHQAVASVDLANIFAERPGRAPDVSSLAGRFILACCCTYMVFVVLLLPLYVAWHMERHFKRMWVASVLLLQWRQQHEHPEPNAAPAAAAAAGLPICSGVSLSSSDTGLATSSSSSTVLAAANTSSTRTRSSDWQLGDARAGVFEGAGLYKGCGVLPPVLALMWQLGLLLAASVAVGHAFVLVLWLAPSLRGLFWQQVVYHQG